MTRMVVKEDTILNDISEAKKIFIDKINEPVRVTTQTWKYMLLHNLDRVVIDGIVMKIKGNHIGAGVYSLILVPYLRYKGSGIYSKVKKNDDVTKKEILKII